MIRLHQFAPAFGLPNASPFCMKVETYLRLVGIPFECVNGEMPMKAPKGKLPFIEDNGQVVADSSFIIEHLKRAHGDPLDGGLSQAQRAAAVAWQRLLEDSLYWALLHSRWIEPAGWGLTREAFFGPLPAPLRWLVPPLARRGMRRQLQGHGMGRHSREEIFAIGCKDLSALADHLADRRYMLGDAPTSLDATAYAFLANVLWAPMPSPLRDHAQGRPELVAYAERVRVLAYG